MACAVVFCWGESGGSGKQKQVPPLRLLRCATVRMTGLEKGIGKMARTKQLGIGAVILVAALAGGSSTELVIPRACMKAVELTEASECHGPDEDHLKCSGLALTVRTECEQVRVIP